MMNGLARRVGMLTRMKTNWKGARAAATLVAPIPPTVPAKKSPAQVGHPVKKPMTAPMDPTHLAFRPRPNE
jgi:hypothetical protein